MSTLELALSLFVILVVFMVVAGPVWTRPRDFAPLDAALNWSMLPIPLLVAAALGRRRALRLRGFALDAVLLLILQHGSGAALAHVLFEMAPEPRRPAPPLVPPTRPLAKAAHERRRVPVDPRRTGVIRGVVRTAEGPAPGAIVWIERGLEGYRFDAPREPLALESGSDGMQPRLAVLQVGQSVSARSTDGRTHTLLASLGDVPLFSIPVLAEPGPDRVVAHDGDGVATVTCTVHPGQERAGALVIVDGPLHTRTDADGRFTLTGVPAGRLHVAAKAEGQLPADLPVELGPRQDLAIELLLAAPR